MARVPRWLFMNTYKKIKLIKAREILDSRGQSTVEVELKTDKGIFFASVPSGVSTGKHEAKELRDEDGKGVKKAISNIEKIIAPAIKKENLIDQKRIDQILIDLDATKDKSFLGANAILAVSMAVCRAGAADKNLSLYQYISEIYTGQTCVNFTLPKPSFNMIEGGKHAENNLAFQEFMVAPQKNLFKENLEIGIKIYKSLKKILQEKFNKKNIGLSQEGAFTAGIGKITDAFDLILKAAKNIGYKNDIKFAIDAAASEFYKNGAYKVDEKEFPKKELIRFYKNLTEKYQTILSIEDPFFEKDFLAFSELKKIIKDKVLIFGDDLTVSNKKRIKLAKKKNACSGLILKPNQIGTVTETIEAAKLAKSYNWKVMVANRAGETEDDFIADLAVGIGADFIKSGAPFPKERMAKYYRLLKIEKELNLIGNK